MDRFGLVAPDSTAPQIIEMYLVGNLINLKVCLDYAQDGVDELDEFDDREAITTSLSTSFGADICMILQLCPVVFALFKVGFEKTLIEEKWISVILMDHIGNRLILILEKSLKMGKLATYSMEKLLGLRFALIILNIAVNARTKVSYSSRSLDLERKTFI